MINQPLTSGDHIKIVIFILLLLPSIFFGVGVIPAIFLAFGIFMMRKNEDFSYIETAVKVFRGYTFFALLICGGFFVYFGYMYFTSKEIWDVDRYEEGFYAFSLFTSIAVLYLFFISALFFNPLSQHKEWVEVNGVFSTKPKLTKGSSINSDVDIIKGEKFKQYSVADELTKWAKLKEDGHISEEEYNEARTKLLKRS